MSQAAEPLGFLSLALQMDLKTRRHRQLRTVSSGGEKMRRSRDFVAKLLNQTAEIAFVSYLTQRIYSIQPIYSVGTRLYWNRQQED
jgi:hypothetical protein